MKISKQTTWLFGRGLSCECNLWWDVSEAISSMPRDEKISVIKSELQAAMKAIDVDVSSIQRLLHDLEQRTIGGCTHLFGTTNWDYLLQREISTQPWTVLPTWLTTSHVFHLNGTVEDIDDNSHRSPFLLVEDPPQQRIQTIEADELYSRMVWSCLFVVVGMSFECATDQFLLHTLNRVEDDLPIGESHWIIVNPDRATLDVTSKRIAQALPRATVTPVCKKFSTWQALGSPDLVKHGVLSAP